MKFIVNDIEFTINTKGGKFPAWESEEYWIRPINEIISPYGLHVHIKNKKTGRVVSYYAEPDSEYYDVSSYIIKDRFVNDKIVKFVEECLIKFKEEELENE